MVPQTPIGKEDEQGDSIPFDPEWYRSAIGSLMYLCTYTRPDLSFAVNALAKFMSTPCEHHAVAVKRVLRYLAGTLALGLTFSGNHDDINVFEGFSDADYAEDKDTRKSTSGICFILNGAAVSWTSKRQSTVASSAAEAEYTALFSATQDSVYLSNLLGDIGIECTLIRIHEDNQPAIHIASNPVTSRHSKHFDVRLHFTREKIQDGLINIVYCPTSDMVADMLTKALDRVKLEKHRSHALGHGDL